MRKTVLITGSSKGLGKSLALVFAKNGYNVVIHGRCAASLRNLEKKILNLGVECRVINGDLVHKTIDSIFIECPMTTISAGGGAVDHIGSMGNKIDILINNAGTHLYKPFHECTQEDILDVLYANLVSPMIFLQKVYTAFAKKKSGIIVNINSLAGKTGAFGETLYCASKHGLRGFSKALQFEATKHNVRIIDVFLGKMQTDICKGSKDFKKYIKTEEAADLIFRTCQSYPSMRTTEIELLRGNY